MEFKAIVSYKGGLAHYNINEDSGTIFDARLIRYDGKPHHHPPSQVQLTKDMEGWSGNCQQPALLDELVKVIDMRSSKKMLS
jgi:hypothetical protein